MSKLDAKKWLTIIVSTLDRHRGVVFRSVVFVTTVIVKSMVQLPPDSSLIVVSMIKILHDNDLCLMESN